jgi:hypothetical protein
MYTLFNVMRIAAALTVSPLAESINPVCQSAMRFVAGAAGIKAAKI